MRRGVQRLVSALGAVFLAFGILAIATPAHADVVNPEMPFKISGNVQNEGTAVPGVTLTVTALAVVGSFLGAFLSGSAPVVGSSTVPIIPLLKGTCMTKPGRPEKSTTTRLKASSSGT